LPIGAGLDLIPEDGTESDQRPESLLSGLLELRRPVGSHPAEHLHDLGDQFTSTPQHTQRRIDENCDRPIDGGTRRVEEAGN